MFFRSSRYSFSILPQRLGANELKSSAVAALPFVLNLNDKQQPSDASYCNNFYKHNNNICRSSSNYYNDNHNSSSSNFSNNKSINMNNNNNKINNRRFLGPSASFGRTLPSQFRHFLHQTSASFIPMKHFHLTPFYIDSLRWNSSSEDNSASHEVLLAAEAPVIVKISKSISKSLQNVFEKNNPSSDVQKALEAWNSTSTTPPTKSSGEQYLSNVSNKLATWIVARLRSNPTGAVENDAVKRAFGIFCSRSIPSDDVAEKTCNLLFPIVTAAHQEHGNFARSIWNQRGEERVEIFGHPNCYCGFLKFPENPNAPKVEVQIDESKKAEDETAKELISILTARHVCLKDYDDPSTDVVYKIKWDSLSDHVKQLWSTTPFRVFIVGGPSGAGKSVLAIQLSKFSSMENITVYIECCGYVLDQDKEKRDMQTFTLVTTAVDNIFQKMKLAQETKEESVSGDGGGRRVVIVIDEIGACPNLLRGLCNVAKDIASHVAEKLKLYNSDAKDETSSSSRRVHFIVAGTGASGNATDHGSRSEHYYSLYLSHLPAVVENIYPMLVTRCLNPSDSGRKLLLRLSRSFTPNLSDPDPAAHTPRSVVENAACDLFTNARAAALFLRLVRSIGFKNAWVNSVASFNLHLLGWMQQVVAEYISVNGLKRATYPIPRLAVAAALSVYRLPFLPVGFLPENTVTKNDPWKFINGATLESDLISKGGILTDDAIVVEKKEATKSFATKLDSYVPQDFSTSKLSLGLPPGRVSRFHASPAHMAMLRSALSITYRHASHHRALELQIADFCLICVISSLPIHYFFNVSAAEASKHLEDLALENYKKQRELIKKFNTNENSKNDPLWNFKNLLLFGETVTKAKILQLSNSALRIVSKLPKPGGNPTYVTRRTNEVVDAFADRLRRIYSEVRKLIKNNSGGVLISPDFECFADLIVVGPNKIVLIQCKQQFGKDFQAYSQEENKKVLKEDFKIDWFGELSKCGLLNVKSYTDAKVKFLFGLTSYDDDIRQLCALYNARIAFLQTLVDACSNTDDDGDEINFEERGATVTAKEYSTMTKPKDFEIHLCFVVESFQERMKMNLEDFVASFGLETTNCKLLKNKDNFSIEVFCNNNNKNNNNKNNNNKQNNIQSISRIKKKYIKKGEEETKKKNNNDGNKNQNTKVENKIKDKTEVTSTKPDVRQGKWETIKTDGLVASFLDSVSLVPILRHESKQTESSSSSSSSSSSALYPLQHSSLLPDESTVAEIVAEFDVEQYKQEQINNNK